MALTHVAFLLLQWELSNRHLIGCLLNYGGQPALLCSGEAVLRLAPLTHARPRAPLPFLLTRGLKLIKDILG